jgi:hypothetical protein
MPTPQLIYKPRDVERLRDSVRAFGFGCLAGAITPVVLRTLQAEAEERFASSQTAERTVELCYRANIISLGTKALEFFCSADAIHLLSAVFDETFEPVKQVSCLTYYRQGDHLGAHRDEPASDCEVTLIAYLSVCRSLSLSPRTGLQLLVYGEDMPNGGKPRLTIPTEVGAIVVGRGSKTWHERPRLEMGESVSALTGCYTLVA